MPEYPALYRHENIRVWHKHGEATPAVPRYVGVELEIRDFLRYPAEPEITAFHKVIDKWHGSVIQDHRNLEIRLAPARGKAFSEQVQEVLDTVQVWRPVIAAQPPCGYHAHVDASDLTFAKLGGVMLAYSKQEPLLLKTQPFARINGKFCKPTGSDLGEGWSETRPDKASALFKEKAEQVVNPAEVNGNGLVAAQRYKAVNFAAWYKYGTIEIRLHEGTVNAEEIVRWGEFWAQFVEYAGTTPMPEIKRLRRSLTALRTVIQNPAVDYVAGRIQKYKAQWTPERLEAVMPKAA